MHSKQQETIDYQESFDPESPWNDVSSFRINQTPGQRFHLQCQKNDFHLKTFVQPSGVLKVLTGDKEINIQGEYLDDSEDQLRVFIDGKMSHVTGMFGLFSLCCLQQFNLCEF